MKSNFSIRSLLGMVTLAAGLVAISINFEAICCRITIGPSVSLADYELLGQSEGTIYVTIYGKPYSTETSQTAAAFWYDARTKSPERLKFPAINGVWKNANEEGVFTLKIGDEFVRTIDD